MLSAEAITAVTLYIIINVVAQATMKQMTDTLPRTKALFWQFIIAVTLSLIAIILVGDLYTNLEYLPMVLIGMINAFGAYCQWRAYAISLSKSVLFMPLSGVISATLAAWFLGEKFLYHSGWLLVGLVFLQAAGFFLAWRKPKPEEKIHFISWQWLVWVLSMVSIFGTAAFMIKGFSNTVPLTTFLVHWYIGACLGAFIIFLFKKEQPKGPFKKRHLLLILVASVALWGSRSVHFWAFQVAPLGLVVPLQIFGLSATSILVGWVVFKEKEQLTRLHVIGFLIGLLGIVAIVVSRL